MISDELIIEVIKQEKAHKSVVPGEDWTRANQFRRHLIQGHSYQFGGDVDSPTTENLILSCADLMHMRTTLRVWSVRRTPNLRRVLVKAKLLSRDGRFLGNRFLSVLNEIAYDRNLQKTIEEAAARTQKNIEKSDAVVAKRREEPQIIDPDEVLRVAAIEKDSY